MNARAAKTSTIAVVGGGSVATSFVRQLAERLKASPAKSVEEVLVFEPHLQPGAGAAYQADTASNLLNTRVASMSPITGRPTHFRDWLGANKARWQPMFPGLEPNDDSFAPRALFGSYLNEVFVEAVGSLRQQGVRVRHVTSRVAAIRRLPTVYEVVTAQGKVHAVPCVVLAIGNLETSDWDHLQHHDRYFNTPYPCNKVVERIDSKKSVCIIGSSLSAIDAAVSLSDAGHEGKIVMVSRNGRLPSVRGEQNLKRAPKLLSRERMRELAAIKAGGVSLTEIAQLLLKELEICEERHPSLDDIMRKGEGPHRYLDSEIAEATECDRAWQAIVYALNDSIDLIWHMLSLDQKREFQSKFKSLWHSYRVSFPIQNALKLQKLLHTDQLTVYGGYKDAFYDDAKGRFSVAIDDCRKRFEATLFADYLVNATGYTNDVTRCRSSLVRGLLNSGLACANEFGGINIDFDTGRVVARSGLPMPGLFALGSLASGTYFWTNAMSVNTRLAAGVVEQALKDCERSAEDDAERVNDFAAPGVLRPALISSHSPTLFEVDRRAMSHRVLGGAGP